MKRSSRLLLLLSTTALFNTPSLASQPGPDDKDFSDNKSSGAHTLYSDVAVSTGPNSTTALNTPSVATSLDPDDKDEAVSANQNQNMQQAKIQYDEALKKTLEEKALKNAQKVDEGDFGLETTINGSDFHPTKWFRYTPYGLDVLLRWDYDAGREWKGPLRKFPTELRNKRDVTQVELSYNKISQVPSESLPPNLEYLGLRENDLEQLDLRAPNLELLSVEGGNPKLKELNIGGMPKLLEIHIGSKVAITGANGEHLKEEPLAAKYPGQPGESIITIGSRRIKVIRYTAEDIKRNNPDVWEKIAGDSANPVQWRFKHISTPFSPRYEVLQEFPDDLREDKSVTQVCLAGNRILKVPSKSLPPNLELLDLSNNPLSRTLALKADNLKFLDVTGNSRLQEIDINGLPHLKELHVNQDVEIIGDVSKIKVVRHIRYVKAGVYSLSKFPDNISKNQDTTHVQDLTHVDLSFNTISQVSSESLPPNLERLNLEKNKLFGTLSLKAPKLEFLNVSDNPELKAIDINDLPHLKEVRTNPGTQIIIAQEKVRSWIDYPDSRGNYPGSSHIALRNGRTIKVKWY